MKKSLKKPILRGVFWARIAIEQGVARKSASEGSMITPKPQWNRHRRELTRDGDVVKRFRRTSPAQIAILDAFEALGWPESIADPLNGGTKKLHSALSKLNRHQGRVIVRFELNGMGRIIWTVVENASGQENSDESGGA